VTRTGRASPGQIGIYEDDLAEAFRPVAETIHREGAKAVVQINHAGMRGRPELNDGVAPKGPSAVPNPKSSLPVTAFTDEEIAGLIRAYGQAAVRVKEIGFDGVQIHGAHGYLISQFLSPHTNSRTDRWGGDFDNRLSFLQAVCEEVRGQVGDDYPMMIKLASQDFVPGGLSPQDGARIVARLADFGIDAVELSGGIDEGPRPMSVRPGIKKIEDEGYFLENARRCRDATDLPLMLVGGFRTPDLMERVVADEGIDFVSLCRPLINDPEFPNKMMAGSDEKAGCISCNLCLEKRDDPLRCWYRYPEK
jgi:2,4-dienoyl-CoA reductase-like NADH-dependent reductase (Old Yellow Enzyme family)